jgi:hypothetical protein
MESIQKVEQWHQLMAKVYKEREKYHLTGVKGPVARPQRKALLYAPF